MGCYGQWSNCPFHQLCPNGDEYEMKCYHAEEEWLDHITALIERDQPGEVEEYPKENYEGSDDQL